MSKKKKYSDQEKFNYYFKRANNKNLPKRKRSFAQRRVEKLAKTIPNT